MRVAIVENTAVTHHGQVGVALHEAGAKIDQFRPFSGQPMPADMSHYDAMVVFGGEQSAVADETHPYLPVLANMMRSGVESGQAVLGVCLGSQLLARGFGATNHIGTTSEFGWQQVTLTDAGVTDPVLAVAGSAFRIFQWHSDTFDLPDGAIHLARSDNATHQAFRIGRAGYATQFHFEANRNVVADWAHTFPDLIDAQDPEFRDELSKLAAQHGHAADVTGLALARAFVGQILR